MKIASVFFTLLVFGEIVDHGMCRGSEREEYQDCMALKAALAPNHPGKVILDYMKKYSDRWYKLDECFKALANDFYPVAKKLAEEYNKNYGTHASRICVTFMTDDAVAEVEEKVANNPRELAQFQKDIKSAGGTGTKTLNEYIADCRVLQPLSEIARRYRGPE